MLETRQQTKVALFVGPALALTAFRRIQPDSTDEMRPSFIQAWEVGMESSRRTVQRYSIVVQRAKRIS